MRYEEILNDKYFIDTYTQIEELKKDFKVNHGFIHINHVIKNVKEIARVLHISDNDKELLLVAACLHDIGYLNGREGHANNGAILAKKYLEKTHKFNPSEIEIITKAIANHEGKQESNYQDLLSCVLILADKFDFVKTRYKNSLESLPFLMINKVKLVKSDKYYLDIYVDKEFKKEDLQVSYFAKLREVLAKLEKVQGIKIELRLIKD